MTIRLLIAALLFPCAALAQSRVTIPVQDPVYRDLDRLIALRLVEVGLYGQRPYSRREIARLTREAVATAQRREVSPATRRIVDRLAARFDPDIRRLEGSLAGSRSWRLWSETEGLWLSSRPRAIPNDLIGFVDAEVDPLLNGRGGRNYQQSENLSAEVRGELNLRDWFAITLHPRMLPTPGRWQAASVTSAVRNVTIEAGRQPIVWGQGMEGGLIFSSSGKPLDMLRISTDLPFEGWFIKGTSPMRGSIVAADLGPNQHFPNSFLIAYKLSGHPFTNRVELAATVMAVQGGRGAPPGTLKDHLMDLIPVLKYTMKDNPAQFSNKMAGWEYRLRLPELRGLQLYAEHAFEDMDPRRWKSTFWEDGGHILGASLNDLGPGGALSTAWEYHHTGLRFYKHGVFHSGMTFDRTLFGDPLGNQGDGGYVRLDWDRGGPYRLSLDAAIERRDGDSYQTVSDGPNEDNFRFQMLQSVPAEWRYRLNAAWHLRRTDYSISLRAGVERVREFGFTRGWSRNNFLLGLSLASEMHSRGSQRP